MRNLAKVLVVFVIIYAISLLSFNRDYSKSSDFNLRVVNSHSLVIGEDYFTDLGEFNSVTKSLLEEIVTAKTKKRAWGYEPHIKLAINSTGGYVSFFERLEVADELLLSAYIECTVSTAISMAFTFMLKYCDERTMLPRARVMQHMVYAKGLFGKIFTDKTKRLSLKFSDIEAKVLGIDRYFWFNESRMKGDRYFTKEELTEFKIATGYIKEPPKKK